MWDYIAIQNERGTTFDFGCEANITSSFHFFEEASYDRRHQVESFQDGAFGRPHHAELHYSGARQQPQGQLEKAQFEKAQLQEAQFQEAQHQEEVQIVASARSPH